MGKHVTPFERIVRQYRQQHGRGLPPTAAFTAAARLSFVAVDDAQATLQPALRGLLTEEEMTAAAGRPVILIDTEQLPHNHLGTRDFMNEQQADERNTALIGQLARRGIVLDNDPGFEEHKECVTSYCFHLPQPKVPSAELERLSRVDGKSLGLPELMHSGSESRAGWFVMTLPPASWSPQDVWLDYLGKVDEIVEQVPAIPDKRLLLQFHELGHARQKIGSKRSLPEQHADERGADRFMFASYTALGGSEAVLEATRAGWALTNFLEAHYIKNSHLTAPALCAGPGMDHAFGPRETRAAYRRLNKRNNRQFEQMGLYHDSGHGLGKRLLALREMWNSRAQMNNEQLFITGVTLEAAGLYMPRLMQTHRHG